MYWSIFSIQQHQIHVRKLLCYSLLCYSLKILYLFTMNISINVDISDLSFIALIKKLTFSYVNIFYGPVNYVHILFLFCFLFRWIILIHGSLAPIMHFYIIDNNIVYRYVNSRYNLIILYVSFHFQGITFNNNYSSLIISCT